jgi:hypothetical protein
MCLGGGLGGQPGFRVEHQYCACRSAKTGVQSVHLLMYEHENVFQGQMGVGAQRRAGQLQRQTNANQREPTPTNANCES